MRGARGREASGGRAPASGSAGGAAPAATARWRATTSACTSMSRAAARARSVSPATGSPRSARCTVRRLTPAASARCCWLHARSVRSSRSPSARGVGEVVRDEMAEVAEDIRQGGRRGARIARAPRRARRQSCDSRAPRRSSRVLESRRPSPARGIGGGRRAVPPVVDSTVRCLPCPTSRACSATIRSAPSSPASARWRRRRASRRMPSAGSCAMCCSRARRPTSTS